MPTRSCACFQVFSTATDLARLGWSFEFHASCLEIYNDELRDLLPPEVPKLTDRRSWLRTWGGMVRA